MDSTGRGEARVIDTEVLLPKLWAAAEVNKERAGKFASANDIESYMYFKGKWLALTEVALYLQGDFDPKVSDLSVAEPDKSPG
jgi:hypothetical protein